MPDRNDSFPNAWQALLLVLALFMADLFVGAAVHDAQGVLALTRSQSDALVSVVANGFLFVVIMHVEGLTYRELFHPSRTSVSATTALVVPLVVLLVPALVLLMTALLSVLVVAVPMSFSEQDLFERMAGDDLATILVGCAIAPAVEEMLFRGVILRSFLRQYPLLPSILGSAALFGFAHLNVYQFVAAFALGSIAGWLYERTQSLIPCIALHSAYNSALAGLEWAQRQSRGFEQAFTSFATWSWSLLVGVAAATMLHRLLRRPSRVETSQ